MDPLESVLLMIFVVKDLLLLHTTGYGDEHLFQIPQSCLTYDFIYGAQRDKPALVDDAYSVTQLLHDWQDVAADEDGLPSTIG